ncbi:MAG: sulfatase/phosphatase domain-containing protein, partial [Lentisphaeria bacterium]
SKAGTEEAALGAFWDIMPTISAWTGAKIPVAVQKKINGINLGGILNPNLPIKKHDYLYWEFPNKQAVRKSNWKAIRFNAKDPNSPLELYDLNKDPLEQKDLAKSQIEMAKQMREIMRNATKESPSVALPN